jgi:hypothetical protein
LAFDINTFKSQLKFGGSRPSLFEIQLTNPIDQTGDGLLPFMARASAMPAFHNTPIPVYYFGRAIKVAGNRTFDDWTINVYNDENFVVRNAMETWSNSINKLEQNIRALPTSEQALYKSTGVITQKSQTGQDLRQYQFVGMFPILVSPMELDWTNDSNIGEFQITFAYDYFYPLLGPTGNGGGS